MENWLKIKPTFDTYQQCKTLSNMHTIIDFCFVLFCFWRGISLYIIIILSSSYFEFDISPFLPWSLPCLTRKFHYLISPSSVRSFPTVIVILRVPFSSSRWNRMVLIEIKDVASKKLECQIFWKLKLNEFHQQLQRWFFKVNIKKQKKILKVGYWACWLGTPVLNFCTICYNYHLVMSSSHLVFV